jgi:hypothetical protein
VLSPSRFKTHTLSLTHTHSLSLSSHLSDLPTPAVRQKRDTWNLFENVNVQMLARRGQASLIRVIRVITGEPAPHKPS